MLRRATLVSSRRLEQDLVADNRSLSWRSVKEGLAAGLLDSEVPRGITPGNTYRSAPPSEGAVAERVLAVVACGLKSDKVRYQRLITQWAHGVTAISDLNVSVCDRIFWLEVQVQPALGMLGQGSKQ